MKVDFTGQVALVTGGGGGIGRAVCLEFARAGAGVVVVDLDPELGEETAALVKREGVVARFIQADVTKSVDVEAYVRNAVSVFGRIDFFINNAGIEGSVHPVHEYPEEMFDRVMAVNVKGSFLGLKYVIPVMLAQKKGAIVNMSSGAGLIGFPGLIPYNASKHAILGMNKTTALELAPHGIRVNAICPGSINTRMMRQLESLLSPDNPDAVVEQMKATTPDGRYGEPEEVARLAVFLCSDWASHIVGQRVVIDGGQTAI